MQSSRRQFVTRLAGTAALIASHSQKGMSEAQKAVTKEVLANDPLRPQCHLLPARNWMNDPNGPIYWKGVYHMFFQYNPNDAVWGDMHWNHAISSDMIHWQHRPIAIAPTPGGADQEGVYSGTAFVYEGRVGMMYTGVKESDPEDATIKTSSWRETQCIAMADNDELSSFTKWDKPVIAKPPAGLQVNGFRDPSPWKQGDWWYTPIASGLSEVGGAILLYRSKDLRNWEFVKIFSKREPSFEAYMPWDVWECPEFFRLGDHHVLIYSTMGKAFWQTGIFNPETLDFQPKKMGILDYGSFYAPKTQLDADGNRILWGWIQESRPTSEYQAAGWAGMMGLPRVLTVGEDGSLRYHVAEQAKTIRSDERKYAGQQGRKITLEECRGEVLYTTKVNPGKFKLEVSGSRDSAKWLSVWYDPATPEFIFIESRAIRVSTAGGDLNIHLYLDGSIVELFVNDQIAWTKRFYYAGASQGATLSWDGGDSLKTATVWNLSPISPDRLTS